jgi:hypothetical protein
MRLLERVKIGNALSIYGSSAIRAFGVRSILIAIPNGIGRVCDPGEAVRACIVSAWDENGWICDGIVANWTL